MTFAEAVAAFKARLNPQAVWLNRIADRTLSGDHSGLYVIDVGDWRDDLMIHAHSVFGRVAAIVYPASKYEVTHEPPYRVMISPIGHGSTVSLDIRDLAFNRVPVPPDPQGMTRDRALALVIAELDRAQTKFPTWPTDPLHAASILAEEMGELQQAIQQVIYEPDKAQPDDVQTEAVQTAAMALRFLLSLDRYVYARSEQHTQEKA